MMDRLLAPAILFINQLNYASKFILVSLLFYIPLSVMSFVLINSAYQDIVTADNKVQGIAIIDELFKVRKAAEKYRDLQAVNISLEQFKESDLHQASQAELQRTLKQFVENNESFLDEHYPDFSSDLTRLVSQAASVSSSNGEVAAAFTILGGMVSKIDQYINLIKETSGLGVENDPAIRSMFNLILNQLLDMQLLGSRVRAFSMYGINMNYLNTATYDFLDKSFLDLHRKAEGLQLAYEQTIPNAVKTERVQQQLESIITGVDELLTEIDENLINASELPKEAQSDRKSVV